MKRSRSKFFYEFNYPGLLIFTCLGLLLFSGCRLDDNKIRGTMGSSPTPIEIPNDNQNPSDDQAAPTTTSLNMKVASGGQYALAIPGAHAPLTFVHSSGSGSFVESGAVFHSPASSNSENNDTVEITDAHMNKWILNIVTGSAGAVDDTLDSGDSQVGTGTNVYDSLPGNAVGSYHNSNGDVYISVSNGGSNYLSRFSEDGTFDSSFGTAGKVTTANFGGRITLDNSGNLLIANANQVQRYLNKETFDTSFGSAGTATTCVSCYIHSVIVDSNDNIKLVGNKLIASFFNYAFMVDQLTPNGLPDPSFNGGSPLISNRTSNTESFNGVLTNSSNDFLMAGQYNYIGGNSNIFVARYKNDSSLDTTFSGGELNIDPLGNSGGDVGMGIAYDNNGKIVVVGTQTDFVTLMRFNTNGTFDTSFGGTGKVSLKVSPNGNFFVDGANYGFGIDSLNRIIVTGRQGSYPDHLTLVRFLEDGNPDSTFGSGGIVDIVPTSGITSLGVPRVFISQDDSILHFSNINTGSGARIAVTRFWP